MADEEPKTNREYLQEFVEVYKSQQCLWKVKSKGYHDRIKRERSYLKLVAVLKKIEPSANIKSVVKRINNMRSNYKKELKKVKSSLKSELETGAVYVPTLWYFKLFTFLDDQETKRTSFPNVDSNDEFEEQPLEDSGGICIPNSPLETSVNKDCSQPKFFTSHFPHSKTSKRKLESAEYEVLMSVRDSYKRSSNTEDRYDIFGKNVAMKLRDLPNQQRILAEKIINESLYEAEMGTLTKDHKLTDLKLNLAALNSLQYPSHWDYTTDSVSMLVKPQVCSNSSEESSTSHCSV